MAIQKYVNLAQSTLASNYTAGDTTLTLQSGDGALFPTAGDFTVAIDDPPFFFLKCTSRAGDVLTVTSTGQEGTTATNKSIGTKVTQVITAAVLDGIRADISGVDVDANLPGTAKKGDRYSSTDLPYEYVYNGSAWIKFPRGLALLEQHTASNSTSLDFTSFVSSAFDEYLIEILNIIPVTSGSDLQLICSTNGGSTYDTGSNYACVGSFLLTSASGTTGFSSDSTTHITVQDTISNNSNYGLCASWRLFSPSNTGLFKVFIASPSLSFSSGSSKIVMESIVGVYKVTTALNAIRFIFSSGNISSGIIRIYGIPKSITI